MDFLQRSLVSEQLLESGVDPDIISRVCDDPSVVDYDSALVKCRELESCAETKDTLAPLNLLLQSRTFSSSSSIISSTSSIVPNSEKKGPSNRPPLIRRSSSKLSTISQNVPPMLQRQGSAYSGFNASTATLEVGPVDGLFESDFVDQLSNGVFSTLQMSYTKYETIKGKDYYNISSLELFRLLKEHLDRVIEIFNISTLQALEILRHYNWNMEIFQEKCSDDLPGVMKLAGIEPDSSAPLASIPTPDESYQCIICFCDYPPEEYRHAGCGHWTCQECWKGLIESKVRDGECIIQCPAEKCQFDAKEDLIRRCIDTALYERYMTFYAKKLIMDHPFIVCCMGNDCDRVFISQDADVVDCSCGSRICISCKVEDHAPCTCEMIQKWKDKESSQDSSLNWIKAHTKDCPRCKWPILKNDGCNHMTCGQCKYEFCWICMKDYRQFGACSKTSQENDLPADGEAKSLRNEFRRYDAKYNLYFNHKRSLETAYGLLKQIMTEQSYSTEDRVILKAAFTVLIKGRSAVCNTIILSYFMEKIMHMELFEHQQAELILAVEKLNKLLVQRPISIEAARDSMSFVKAHTAAMASLSRDVGLQNVEL